MLLVETEEQKKKAAVIVGRYNPPHIGHYALFKEVKSWIKKHPDLNLSPLPIVVVVEGKKTSLDTARNPLSAKDRISAMTASNKADGVKFLTAGSAYAAFEEVRAAGYEPIAVAVGTDRADGKYVEMLDKYFKTENGEPIKHYSIELDRQEPALGHENLDKEAALDDVLKYLDKDVPVSMVSGTLARHAVERGEFKKFQVIVGIEDDNAAKIVFNKIKRALDAAKENDGKPV